jgi:hypothetical protein
LVTVCASRAEFAALALKEVDVDERGHIASRAPAFFDSPPEVRESGKTCSCPGPGTVYLGRTFESTELVFIRSLEVDA